MADVDKLMQFMSPQLGMGWIAPQVVTFRMPHSFQFLFPHVWNGVNTYFSSVSGFCEADRS